MIWSDDSERRQVQDYDRDISLLLYAAFPGRNALIQSRPEFQDVTIDLLVVWCGDAAARSGAASEDCMSLLRDKFSLFVDGCELERDGGHCCCF